MISVTVPCMMLIRERVDACWPNSNNNCSHCFAATVNRLVYQFTFREI